MAYALFYRGDILFAIQKSLPRVEVPGFMKVAVSDIRIFFQADDIEDIIPVGDLPGVDVFRIPVPVVPEVIRVFAHVRHSVRMAGDDEGVLPFSFQKNFFIIPAG
jgi:hypothetical protein